MICFLCNDETPRLKKCSEIYYKKLKHVIKIRETLRLAYGTLKMPPTFEEDLYYHSQCYKLICTLGKEYHELYLEKTKDLQTVSETSADVDHSINNDVNIQDAVPDIEMASDNINNDVDVQEHAVSDIEMASDNGTHKDADLDKSVLLPLVDDNHIDNSANVDENNKQDDDGCDDSQIQTTHSIDERYV